MDKKNICFFLGDISKVGGIERTGSTLANEIANLDSMYNVYILSISKINKEIFFKLNNNISVTYIYNRQARYKKDYFYILSKVRKFIKQNNIDIIINVDSMLGMFSIPAKSMLKCKLISWEHFNYNENSGTKIMDISRKLSARYSDYMVVLTDQDRKLFELNLNMKCPITYIYNPVNMNKREINYNLDSKTILSVGRLTHQKGFDMLIDVAKKVLSEKKDWNWIIVGEGEDRQALQNKINKYNLQDRVKLIGNKSNIEEYYKQASMFVLTSRYEGLGLVLVEAKAYKIPIVSFNCNFGPSEIIHDKRDGYLIECFDIQDMCDKIIHLIENDNTRKEFSNYSNENLLKFKPENIVEQWECIFKKLMQK